MTSSRSSAASPIARIAVSMPGRDRALRELQRPHVGLREHDLAVRAGTRVRPRASRGTVGERVTGSPRRPRGSPSCRRRRSGRPGGAARRCRSAPSRRCPWARRRRRSPAARSRRSSARRPRSHPRWRASRRGSRRPRTRGRRARRSRPTARRCRTRSRRSCRRRRAAASPDRARARSRRCPRRCRPRRRRRSTGRSRPSPSGWIANPSWSARTSCASVNVATYGASAIDSGFTPSSSDIIVALPATTAS